MTEKIKNGKRNLNQHSILQAVILHLLPGVLVLLFYIIVAPKIIRLGFPSLFASILSFVFVLIPFELGYLLYQGKKITGKLSLKGVVHYNAKTPIWQYFILVPVLILWSAIIYSLSSELIGDFLADNIFYWLPDWFSMDIGNVNNYTKTVLLITWSLGLIFMGIAAVVEELYFRGYLLPRLSRFKWCAPLINTLLFSSYHLDLPTEIPRIVVTMLPIVYIVWWKKNIKIGLIVHLLVNVTSMLIMLPIILK